MGATRLDERKQQILEDEGYRYNFDRQLYVNRKTKMAFSVEFVEDNTEEKLSQLIHEETRSRDWRFRFITEPSEAVKRELIDVLA